MRSKNFSAFLISFLLLAGAGLSDLWASDFKHPDFEPPFSLSDIFTDDQAPSSFSADEVFKLGLLFSECQPGTESWNHCLSEFEKIKTSAKSSEMQALSEEARGRALLKYLYRDYLKSYSFNQTRLNTALENGSYNCVSSAVLYLAAAKAAGLSVYGQRTTQHAFCSIYVPGSKAGQTLKIDVETTNPYGFNPGSKEEIENANQIKQYYVVPKKYYANRKQVSDGVFTGLIAGNLCSDYIKTGEYSKALPLGAARYLTVPSEDKSGLTFVRGEFDILPCNYINILPESAAEYASRLEWFTTFIDRWGKTDFIQKNMDASFNNLFVLCVREKNLAQAEESYEKLSPYVSQKQLDKSHEALADIVILSKTDGQDSRQQLLTIQELKESQNFTEAQQKRADLYLEQAWLEILNAHMNNRDYTTGYAESQAALQQLPQSSGIKKMNQGFYSNCIAQIHNDFAREANRQNFDKALEILNEGLARYPDDKTLNRDMADLKKILLN